MGKSAVREFLADDCMGLSQQAAYNSLLAFFPATIFLVSLLGLLGAYDTLEQFLDPVAPRAVTDLIRQLRQDTGRGGSVTAFVLGGIGAVWAASGATNALVKAVNRAYDRPETRPFWRVRLVAIGLVLALGVVVTGVLLLIVFGGPIGNAIARRAHLDGQFSVLWNLVRWPIAFAAVLLLFGLVYALAADRPRRAWKWITPGSVLGALLWLALSGLFALYTSLVASYSRTYGSLASGIVLLLWLNYSALSVLFGAELNAELERRAAVRARGGEDAGLIRLPQP